MRLARNAPCAASAWLRWAKSYLVVGLCLLANGAALTLHIVQGSPLPTLLLVFWAGGLVAIAWALVRAQPVVREHCESHLNDHPPSTAIVCPVTMRASSLSR